MAVAERGEVAAHLPAAIRALSVVLPGIRVLPETFRLAKFDQPQASIAFWKLLYPLLKQIQGAEKIELTDTGALISFIKNVALSHGYRRLQFYQLPSDGSEGSKELLLVFSWFMCRIGLVEKLMTLSRVKTWDEATVCTCGAPPKRPEDGRTLAPNTHLTAQRDIRYVQWLNGQLRFRWWSWHCEQQEYCKLLHKVHSYTVGCHTDPAISHFSVTEADVVRQPDNYKQLLKLVESESSQLEAFLKWKSLEPIFWCWMETVLEPSTEDEKPHTACNEDSVLSWAGLGFNGVGRMAEEIDRCRNDLVALYDRLCELVASSKLVCEKVSTRERELLGEREFCRVVKRAQEAVELKLSALKCHTTTCSINKRHGPYRLVFKGKHLKTSKTGSINSTSNRGIAEGITAADVISGLRKQEARLKAELTHLQEEGKQKVYEASKGLPHVLFIPPMKRPKARDAAQV